MGNVRYAEKRSPNYPRVDVDFPVEFSCAGRKFQDRAKTLGGGGMFVTVTTPLPTGAETQLRFRPAKHLPIIQAKAKVLYQIPLKGTGMEFTEIDPQDRQLLLRLIHRRLADQRRCPRAPLVTQVECNQFMCLASSRNVSADGMFVEAPQPFPVRSRLRLRFHLDDGGPVIVAVSEVIYQLEKLGIGVQFVQIDQRDRERIEAYVARSMALANSAAGGALAA